MTKRVKSPPSPGRRDFIRKSALTAAVAATGLMWRPSQSGNRGRDAPRIVVVGAGAFGGWTAMHLLRRGADVVLVDAFGAGHSRSSSGGETRVIRGMYGPNAIYMDWVVRSFELWREAEAEWGGKLYTPTGALWMFRGDDGYARESLPLMAERNLPVDELSVEDARRRFPRIDFDGVETVYFERRAGFLAARDSCRLLAEKFAAAGGAYRRGRAAPGTVDSGGMKHAALASGEVIDADGFVFACGPWLGELFPDLLGEYLHPTRQEVYMFGTPAGDDAFDESNFPVWVDFGERLFYGIPGNFGRGFKIADDTRGGPADPTSMQRTPSAEGIERARRQLAERFPALAGAPLVEARVCQYTNSPDGHLIIDRHPEIENVWIAGGGSGHGFKFAPALGEHVAGLVLGDAEAIPMFSLARFS